jgi:transcriptional regulator with XRE-family HTH domain
MNHIATVVTETSRTSARATDADKIVGQRIREQRIMSGLNQQDLAAAIGVTYQQMHKYERGVNRISAGRLHELAKALGVPVSVFFDGLDGAAKPLNQRGRQCLELVKNYNGMDADQQDALARIARIMSEARA